MIDTLAGTWRLTGFAHHDGELRRIGQESDPAELDAWLNGRADAPALGAAGGLELLIRRDGGFDEQRTGPAAVPWFDAEGVLVEHATPFAGTVVPVGDTLYLRPAETNSWARPDDTRHGPARLRYDDDDTKIADGVTLDEERLVRTVNVVTDELYLNRVTLVYER